MRQEHVELGILRPGRKNVFRFPVPGDWGGGVQVTISAQCGKCYGRMIIGKQPMTLVCENSNWLTRKLHSFVVLEASVERVERGYP